MADENINQTQKFLRNALNECDASVQAATEKIAALARAASKMLALDAKSLVTVDTLLTEILNLAMKVQNDVNCTAESQGANWKDEQPNEVSARLWKQHHALHATLAQEVSHA